MKHTGNQRKVNSFMPFSLLPITVVRHTRFFWCLFFLGGFVILAIGLGLRDPWPADEPRFALNALEMLKTGQFWFPHRAGEIYPDKPPVFMWAMAIGIALTGSVRWGFMLPSLLAAFGTLFLVADLTKRLYGIRIALLAGVALLSTFQFALQARTAQIDMSLTFFTTLGAYGFLRYSLIDAKNIWWYVSWIAMGIGILTKGVGFLPLALIPGWILFYKQGVVHHPAWKQYIKGFSLLILTVSLWVVPMVLIATFGDDSSLTAYRDNILFKQTGERYANSWHHLNPWYYYLASVIPWAWLPLILAFPWLIKHWQRRLRRRDAKIWMPLSAILLILLFFSLSPGKRGVYILPTIPLLIWAVAPSIPGLLQQKGLNYLATFTIIAISGTLLTAGVLGGYGVSSLNELSQHYGVVPWNWWMTIGALSIPLILWLKPHRGMLIFVIWMLAFWVSWSTWGYVLMNTARSPHDMMQNVQRITGKNASLALPDFDEEFVLQAQQPVVQFGFKTPLEKQLQRAYAWVKQSPDERWILTRANQAKGEACIDQSEKHDLGIQNSDHWWLLPGSAFSQCPGNKKSAPLYEAPTTK